MLLKRLKKRGIIALSVISAGAAIAIAGAAVSGISHGHEKDRASFLSDAVRKAAVQCYAIEGFYPADIGYLEENYALIVDRNKYFIYYEAFASNILPRIDVYEVDADGRVSRILNKN